MMQVGVVLSRHGSSLLMKRIRPGLVCQSFRQSHNHARSRVGVYKIAARSPNDVAGLDLLIQRQEINPKEIVAILGKTEGNGCVNDFTRGYAVSTLKQYLSPFLKDDDDDDDDMKKLQKIPIVYVMSGGTEGVLSPHWTVFTRAQENASKSESQKESNDGVPSLTIGINHTRDFLANEVGTRTMVDEVAKGVQAAMEQAQIHSEEDVHFVQIKCPLVRADGDDGGDSSAGGSYHSMAMSRGASALGVALALKEVADAQITNATVCCDYSLYSKVASTSAGSELRNCEIMVLGNSTKTCSDFVIGHDVMEHALDKDAIFRAIEQAQGLITDGSDDDNWKLVNILAKAEASPTGQILGARHTMLDDSDISHTRMARAVVGAVVASAVQDPMVYVSGGAEHQGPPGGGPVAAILQKK